MRGTQAVLLDEGRIGGYSNDRHRDGVSYLADEGPKDDDHLDIGLGQQAGHRPCVRLPPQIGFLPQGENEIVRRVRLDGEGARQRPREVPGSAVVDLDLGAAYLKVVELFGFDPGKWLRIVALSEEVCDGPGGGVAGIVPAFPSQDASRAPQLRSGGSVDVVHGFEASEACRVRFDHRSPDGSLALTAWRARRSARIEPPPFGGCSKPFAPARKRRGGRTLSA